MADFEQLSVLDALNASIAVATHLEPRHAATVGAARALAAKIDAWDVIVQWALEDAHESEARGARPAVPANDNTSLGTYSRYLEQLGLTVAAPAKATGKKPEAAAEPEPVPAPGGKVSLSMIRGAVGKTG